MKVIPRIGVSILILLFSVGWVDAVLKVPTHSREDEEVLTHFMSELDTAVENNDWESVGRIDSDIRDHEFSENRRYGLGVILLAAYFGNQKIIERLVGRGNSDDATRYERRRYNRDERDGLFGGTILHWAALGGQWSLIRWLNPADINPLDNHSSNLTPYNWACSVGLAAGVLRELRPLGATTGIQIVARRAHAEQLRQRQEQLIGNVRAYLRERSRRTVLKENHMNGYSASARRRKILAGLEVSARSVTPSGSSYLSVSGVSNMGSAPVVPPVASGRPLQGRDLSLERWVYHILRSLGRVPQSK